MPQQPLAITGKNLLPVNQKETYRVVPEIPDAEYYWGYSDTALFQLYPLSYYSSSDYYSSEINVVALEGAKQGHLTCYVHINGMLYDSVSIPITPVYRDIPYALRPLECTMDKVSDCSGSSISEFTFNTLSNQSADCNASGYSDFTGGNLSTTVKAGKYYDASFTVSGSANQNQYAAVWIDFNNDGDFDDPGEYGGSTIIAGGKGLIHNIKIPESGFYEQVRLRARTRAFSSYSPTDNCTVLDQPGETEDYAVYISKGSQLNASEAVTPNNDGKNDFFVVTGTEEDTSSDIVITDAFGNLIFENQNYQNTWPQQPPKKGTYYYQVKNGTTVINGFFVVNY
jgi:gliding motility-associated-like protein